MATGFSEMCHAVAVDILNVYVCPCARELAAACILAGLVKAKTDYLAKENREEEKREILCVGGSETAIQHSTKPNGMYLYCTHTSVHLNCLTYK